MSELRKGKYANHYYCNSHKWVLKTLCIKVQLKSGMYQTRCPFCHGQVREFSKFRKDKNYLDLK